MNQYKFSKPFGQGLLEAVVAIGVIMVGIVSIVMLSTSSVTNSNSSQFRIMATNLAREGIEVARAIRDDSWLDGKVNGEWMTTLSGDGGDAILVLSASTLNFTWSFDFSANSIQDALAKIWREVSTGLHRQSTLPIEAAGGVSDTGYNRLINFYRICRDASSVESASTRSDFTSLCNPGFEQVGLRVVSTVQWRESGRTSKIVLEDFLYNWRFTYVRP